MFTNALIDLMTAAVSHQYDPNDPYLQIYRDLGQAPALGAPRSALVGGLPYQAPQGGVEQGWEATPIGGMSAQQPGVAGTAGFVGKTMYRGGQPQTPAAPPPPSGMPFMSMGPAEPQVTRTASWGGTKYDDAAVESYRESLGYGGQIAQAAADDAQVYAARETQAAQSLGADLEGNRKRWADDRKRIQGELDPQEQKLLKLAAKVQEGKVDPDRFWSSRSEGQQAALLISAMLGGFTEGFTQGRVRNRAVGIIENAINRDINAQKANIMAARGALESQQGIVSAFYRQLGNVDRAAELGRVAMYDAYKVKLAGVSAAAKGTAEQAKALLAQNHLEVAQNKLLMDITARKFGGTKVTRTGGPGGGLDALYKQMAIREKMQKLGMVKRPTDPKAVTALGQGVTALEDWSDWFQAVWKEKTAGLPAPKKYYDVPEAVWTQTFGRGQKGKAVYDNLFTHAMAATRELSGAQAAVIETRAQQRLQPSPGDSQEALQYKARNFIRKRLRSLVATRNARSRFEDTTAYNEAIKRVVTRGLQLGNMTGDQEMLPMIQGAMR
jgi:hypothetical protein